MSLGAVYPVQANIIADGSAAAGMQPGIGQNNAGITQFDIQAPGAAGVSHNKFKQFDVDSPGVILNNSQQDIQSMLGGDVKANANLTSRTAEIILNEINSSNPSQLNGFIEVAGSKAQVIIANPSGITCNGCGFINASRAVLTTGQAQMEDGELTGFRVEKGAVSFEGNGMYVQGSDYTDILARSVKINSMISFDNSNLNVITGRNQVDMDGNITALEDDSSNKPQIALDVTSPGAFREIIFA